MYLKLAGWRRSQRVFTPCLPVLVDELGDDGGVGEGRRVADPVFLERCHFAQDAAHDLPRPRLGQVAVHDEVRGGDGPDGIPDGCGQDLGQVGRPAEALAQDDEAPDAFPFDVVREPHHGGLGHLRARNQRRLDFRGAEAVAGRVDHVVHAPRDPVVTVFVPPAAVAREVITC